MRSENKISKVTSLSKALWLGCSSLAVGMGSMGLALPAIAQDATEEEPKEIIVTAQKREQSLQDVPIVITTLSAKLLQDSGVRDIKDMQVLTPGLTVSSTQNETLTTARIRGVGTVGDNPGLESSVGVVIDGVYRPRNGVGFGDLGELERIEVLKGPQGTLFGKNTSAGVINIISKAPQFRFQADGEVTLGDFDTKGIAASVTGPLSEDLAAGRLYVAKRERGGFYDVATAGGPRTLKEDQTQDFTTIRGQVLITPGANTFRVIADYTKREEFCCAAVQTRSGPTAPAINALTGGLGIASVANPEARLAYLNRNTTQKISDGGISVEANIKLDFLDSTLTSVTGVRRWDNTNGQDIDYTGADILYRRDNGEFGAQFDTFSQELRLAGATEKWNWLVGAFYSDEDLKRLDSYTYGIHYESYLSLLLSQALTGTGNPNFVSVLTGRAPNTSYAAGATANDVYKQNSRTLALFTNHNYQLTDKLELTMGLRYTQESKDIKAQYSNSDGGIGCASALGRSGLLGGTAVAPWTGLTIAQRQSVAGNLCAFWGNANFNGRNFSESKDEKEWSGTLKGAYRFNENLMAYLSYARGYKGGGFNLDRATTGLTPDSSLYFPAETVDSYEFGIKSSLMNNRLLVNVSVFDQTFSDFQLNTFLGTAFVVESIPELTSKGVDADVYWRTPIKGLSLQGGVAYAKTEYGQFTATDLKPGRFGPLSLLPGSQMSFAPEWSSTMAVTWAGNITEALRLNANLAAKYSSEYNTGSDLIPAKQQDAFTLLNARIGISSVNQKWALEFWAQNLTDEVYKQVVINAPLQGSGFQSTVQPNGTFYNPALDTNTYDAFLGAPRTMGVTLRVKY
jgi:iron complex outermembrane recepter protein